MTEPVTILSKHFGAWGKDDPTPAPVTITFRFALGQRVRWACSKDIVVVDGRTYQERRHAAPVIQYRLEAAGHIVTSGAYEPDVEALEEDTPCG